MKRREFITLLGGAAAAWPLVARGQQPGLPVIGFINNGSARAYEPFVESFRQGLRQAGLQVGVNVTIHYRWGEGEIAKLPGFISEFVRLPANVIVTGGSDVAAQQAKAATATIPIIATIGSDPVETGLVSSLHHPGANVTGISVFAVQLVAKRLELARELAGDSGLVAFLVNPINPNSRIDIKEMEAAAKELGQAVELLPASSESECDAAFVNLTQKGGKALIVESDPFFNSMVERLVTLARRSAVPVVFARREFAIAGGLMSYGSSLSEAYRQLGIYTGRVLKGDKPSDLPIVLPTRFELIVNLRTANELGITIPTAILLRADEVIE
jgi:putative ABC transport system substrate-binding protein